MIIGKFVYWIKLSERVITMSDPSSRLRRRLRLRDLDTLLAVADAGGMRKAAQALHMSQPAVSKAISDLEGQLGVRLFDRTREGVEPTVFGQALMRRGKVIFDELRQGVNELGFLSEPGVGELSLGSGESLMASLVPAVIELMQARYPRLVFKTESADPPVLLNHFLRERICELILIRPWETLTQPEFEVIPLFYEHIRVVSGTGNPLARRRKLSLQELSEHPWVLSHVEVRAGSPVVQAFEAAGVALPRKMILSGSLNLRQALLATGRYVTVVPNTVLAFGSARAALKVLPIDLPPWSMATSIVLLRNRTLSAIAQMFIEQTRHSTRHLVSSPHR